MLVDALGLLGCIGLITFYIPQLVSVWRAPRLRGFNLLAWSCGLVGCAAIGIQMFFLQVWTTFALEVIAAAVTLETIRQVARKQR